MQSDVAFPHVLNHLNQFGEQERRFLLRLSQELQLPIGTMQMSEDEPRRSPKPLRTPDPRQTAVTDEHPIVVPSDFADVHRAPTEPRMIVIPPAAR